MDVMNREIKAQWLSALRSGKYKKTKNRLKSETGFCCLGVLCDITNPKGWKKGWGNSHNFIHHESCNDTFLPDELRKEAGITLAQERVLAYRNDNSTDEEGYSLVISYIEKNM